MPAETIQLLREYRKEWLAARSTYGTMWNAYIDLPDEDSIRNAAHNSENTDTHSAINDYLFYQENSDKVGYPIHPDSITGWCADFSEKNTNVLNKKYSANRNSLEAVSVSGFFISTSSHKA